jgi:hypothetical protein
MVMKSTWSVRELPVLEATVSMFDEMGNPGIITVKDLSDRVGLAPRDVWTSLLALKGEYVTLQMVMAGGNPEPQMVTGVTSAARRAVGQWPTAEGLIDQLMADLSEAIQHEADPAKKSRLQAVASSLTAVGRDVLVSLISAAVRGHI